MSVDPMTSPEQAEAEADERHYEDREDRRCLHDYETCEGGPATEYREGKPCCAICAGEYDNLINEIAREFAGNWRDK